MDLIEDLKWRYAVKKYSDKTVDQAKIDRILEATNLSASSAGMQPYRLFLVQDQEMKNKLGEGSFNGQIAEAPYLLVFAAYTSMGQQFVDNYIAHVAAEREIPVSALADFKASLEGYILNRSDSENFSWATKQAYIALGTALIAAAEQRVDATPMEGFDSEKFDELLGLRKKGLKSVVILSFGYRHESDAFAGLKKVRAHQEEMVTLV
tara:strand:+ start:1808 stop:2431 length:624 start_codon:yes stop_codon:yes gene_type:complete